MFFRKEVHAIVYLFSFVRPCTGDSVKLLTALMLPAKKCGAKFPSCGEVSEGRGWFLRPCNATPRSAQAPDCVALSPVIANRR
jgi:hypothetical protein